MICCQVMSLRMTYVEILLVLDSVNNISKVFISSIAYSSKINTALMQGLLNKALYDECRGTGFTFVDNGAVTKNDL